MPNPFDQFDPKPQSDPQLLGGGRTVPDRPADPTANPPAVLGGGVTVRDRPADPNAPVPQVVGGTGNVVRFPTSAPGQGRGSDTDPAPDTTPAPKPSQTEPPPQTGDGTETRDFDLNTIPAESRNGFVTELQKQPGVSVSVDPATNRATITARTPQPGTAAPAGTARIRKGLSLQQAESDPYLQARPLLQQEVIRQINQQAIADQALETAAQAAERQQRIQGDVANAEYTREALGLIQKVQAGGAGANELHDLQQRILKDPRFAVQGQHIEHLFDLIGKATNDPESELKKLGAGFWPAMQRIWADPSAPDKITTVDQLHGLAGPGKGVTLAGLERLETELLKPRNKTPAGEGETYLLRSFLHGAHLRITNNEQENDDSPEQNQRWQTFLGHFLSRYDDAREGRGGDKQSHSVADLLTPGSKNYLGGDIEHFVPPRAKAVSDALKDKPQPGFFSGVYNYFMGGQPAAPPAYTDTQRFGPAPAQQPAPPPFDPATVHSTDDLKAAVGSGRLTRQQAGELAVQRGWARPNPAPPPQDTGGLDFLPVR